MTRDQSNFYYMIAIHLVALSLALSGCASANRSAGLGGLLGAGAGAALGGIADPGRKGQYRTRNVVVGAALGTIAGVAAGSAIHDDVESGKREAFLKGRTSSSLQREQGPAPVLRSAEVESIWVDGHGSGNRWIDGHYEHVIKEPARWEAP